MNNLEISTHALFDGGVMDIAFVDLDVLWQYQKLL